MAGPGSLQFPLKKSVDLGTEKGAGKLYGGVSKMVLTFDKDGLVEAGSWRRKA